MASPKPDENWGETRDPDSLEFDDTIRDDDLTLGREHLIEVEYSKIRNPEVEDTKYVGRRVSRVDLLQSDEDSKVEDEDEDEDEDEGEDEGEKINSSSCSDGSSRSSDEEEPELEEHLGAEDLPPSNENRSQAVPTTITSALSQDRSKGLAILQQTELFDSLLESRIRLQKAVTSTNQLKPTQNSNLPPSIEDSIQRTLTEAIKLTRSLSSLSSALSPSFAPKEESAVHEDPNTLLPNLLTDTTQSWTFSHANTIQVLSKWSERTRHPHMVSSSSSSSHRSNHERLFSNKLYPDNNSTRSDIERITCILSARNAEPNSYENDTFDDREFYQKVLQSIIARSSISSNPLHPLSPTMTTTTKKGRQKAQGEAVDTKASKGRKIRYEVHEKLVHFMVPAFSGNEGGVGWHEEQVDELFGFLPGGGS